MTRENRDRAHELIMLVDDQQPVIDLAIRSLSPSFPNVIAFSDPTEAVKSLLSDEHSYDAILSDIVMEPITGLDILRMAHEKDPTLPVLMMTAHGSLDIALKAIKHGAIDLVLKPIEDWSVVIRSLKRAVFERTLRLDNARLLTELQERNAELDRAATLLRRLNLTAQMMHASRDVEQVLNLLVKSATEYLEAKRVSIMIRDPRNDEMGIKVAEGMDKAVVESVRVRPWEGVAGTVAAQRAPIIVDDAGIDVRVPQGHEEDRHYKGRSFMSIPITLSTSDRGSEKVMGVLNVTDRVDDRPFSAMEVEFAAHLARQAALALTGAAMWRVSSKG